MNLFLLFVRETSVVLRLVSVICEVSYLIRKLTQPERALIDHEADAQAKKIAKMNGLSLEGHLGRQLTPAMARQYDLILVMERIHLEQIGRIAPEVRGKTMLFGHWLNQKDIPDPYKKVMRPLQRYIN